MRHPFLSISLALMATAFCTPALGDGPGSLASTEPTTVVSGARFSYWGTGFFIDWNGHILTANHVVNACESVDVAGNGSREIAAVVASSAELDLSLLRVHGTFGKPAAFEASAHPPGGAMVTVLGYGPLAAAEREQDPSLPAARNSMVLDEQAPERIALISDAKPGASGSPVIAGDGLVIGILQSKLTRRWQPGTASRPAEIRLAASGAAAVAFLRAQGIAPLEGEAPQHARMNLLGDLAAAEVKVECLR